MQKHHWENLNNCVKRSAPDVLRGETERKHCHQSSIGSWGSSGNCTVELKRTESQDKLMGFKLCSTYVTLQYLSFINLKMRITIVFTFHTVIKIKRGDTCKTLRTMPGTKWVLTNLAILSLCRSLCTTCTQFTTRADINRCYLWWNFLSSVIATELLPQFKLLGRTVSLKGKKKNPILVVVVKYI